MRDISRFSLTFFLALGSLLSFAPREIRQETYTAPEKSNLASHFEAAWSYLGKALNASKSR